MRYNEKNCIHIGDKNAICKVLDNNSIFEVSMIVISNLQGKISSNFDLTVFGDINADSLHVLGNFICFGNCSAETMDVQGTCTIFGSLQVNDGLLSESLIAKDIDCNSLSVNSSLQCETISCDGIFTCKGKAFISDGIMGLGKIDCDLIVCGEYADIDETSRVVVINELEKLLDEHKENKDAATYKKDDYQEKVPNIPLMDWSECLSFLEDLAIHHKEFMLERDHYKELFQWAEYSKLSDIKQFIQLLNLIYQPGEIFRNSDLYAVIKKELFEKSFEYLYDLSLPSITQAEFSELLFIITTNRDHLDPDAYRYLQEVLYSKIGLKYSTVSLMLEDK